MTAPREVARHVLVTGDVQGVGFRWATQRAAERAGVRGWVRNLPDGRVEALLQGAPEAVDGVLAWMRAGGPPSGRVTELRAEASDADATLARFEIRR